MKHAQRQYAIKRLNEIYKTKEQVIIQAGAAAEAALGTPAQLVCEHYPDFSDVIRKLAGFENDVVLKPNYREALTNFQWPTSSHYFYPNQYIHTWAEPTNSAVVAAAKVAVAAKEARHKTQVLDKLTTLKAKLVESTDALILGDEDAAVQALANFQNFEV